MRRRDLDNIRRGEFSGHTKLVHDLAACAALWWDRAAAADDERSQLRSELGATNAFLDATVANALVVLHHDGRAEVYGQRSLRVRIANYPNTTEAWAEGYLEKALPRCYRELYMPGLCVAEGRVADCRTPRQELERLHALACLRALDRIKEH